MLEGEDFDEAWLQKGLRHLVVVFKGQVPLRGALEDVSVGTRVL